MSNSQPLYITLQTHLRAGERITNEITSRNSRGTRIQVPKTGKRIAAAYEQFRNAAEFSEEHLLLQRAIRRFYNRDIFVGQRGLENIGEELVLELTHAGYLRNNSISSVTTAVIREMVRDNMRTYGELRKARVPRETAMRWVLDVMSVESEAILNPHEQLSALALVSYDYFLNLFPRDKFSMTKREKDNYEASLFVAVHLALLKSDQAIVRRSLIKMYSLDPHKTKEIVTFNKSIDALFESHLTQRLRRAVSRRAAPLRVLKELLEDRPDAVGLLEDRETFLSAFGQQVTQEYRRVSERLDRGIFRSVVFLFLTKVVFGIAVEIPYDLITTRHVALLPLTLNLLFPPLYIASLSMILRPPTRANAASLITAIDRILYLPETEADSSVRLNPRQIRKSLKIIYGILLVIPLVLIVTLLKLLGFSFVQGVIFFVFMSTASFLGFRLSKIVSELEIETRQGGFLATVGDFFSLPFIMIGQWLSGKYARFNAVGMLMDMAIEMPLKSSLRLVRQWTSFLREQREEIS